ncbi:MAG: peptidoglycan editing factor PgeF [Candidatus Marinimicrobia bacterium]|nr:peptidoglycan editing factor PgeF [Candidatus Neomarinimicrobiota bacterium]|tara:strand:+ start:2488 stop:3123 length:636 start_codon:yes stop_codon:yes gene_type:complete
MVRSSGEMADSNLHSLTEIAASKAGFEGNVSFCTQIHSSTVVQIKSSHGEAGRCDGLLTDSPDTVLSIRVADCVPVFMHCSEKRAIGLIHAGWRGTAAGIAQEAVLKMKNSLSSPIEKLEVALGPSIRSCCYEVGSEVAENFSQECLTSSRPNHFMLDLPQENRIQLEREGIPHDQITDSSHCTCCSSLMFHSYRRDGEKSGRMICLFKLV